MIKNEEFVYLYLCKDCGETSDRGEVIDDHGVYSCPVCGCDVLSYERFER